MTQRPDLLDGAVIGYPVLDMLRFHKLSVGKYWVDEYGNPDDPKERRFLRRYSPYHNVRKTRYPPTMIYTSLHDDRVHPAHAFKFAAKLEKAGGEVWLRVQAKGGHAGSSPQTRIRELTDVVAFIRRGLDQQGISLEPRTLKPALWGEQVTGLSGGLVLASPEPDDFGEIPEVEVSGKKLCAVGPRRCDKDGVEQPRLGEPLFPCFSLELRRCSGRTESDRLVNRDGF